MMRLTTDTQSVAEAEYSAMGTMEFFGRVMEGPRWEFPHRHLEKPSNVVAYERLRCIVLQDREVCPAWRWVQAEQRTAMSLGFASALMGIAGRALMGDRYAGALCEAFAKRYRRRFRWERRA